MIDLTFLTLLNIYNNYCKIQILQRARNNFMRCFCVAHAHTYMNLFFMLLPRLYSKLRNNFNLYSFFHAGFKTLHYTADMGDPATDEDVRCLCLEPEGCMPKNVYNAGPCLNAPIRISLPHLYNSDRRYYELIDGLNPDPVSVRNDIMIWQGLTKHAYAGETSDDFRLRCNDGHPDKSVQEDSVQCVGRACSQT